MTLTSVKTGGPPELVIHVGSLLGRRPSRREAAANLILFRTLLAFVHRGYLDWGVPPVEHLRAIEGRHERRVSGLHVV